MSQRTDLINKLSEYSKDEFIEYIANEKSIVYKMALESADVYLLDDLIDKWCKVNNEGASNTLLKRLAMCEIELLTLEWGKE